MYASHCLYICSPPPHARVPHITSALPSVYAVPRCTTGLYSSRYCHHRRTLPLHCSTVIPAGPYPSWYRRPHGRPLSFNDMTSTPRLHPIFVVAPQSAQLIVHPAIASSAPSNLSLPGLVQPLPSALYRHCSVLSALHTAVHAVLIVFLPPVFLSLGLAHQRLSPNCSLQSRIVSSPLPLTDYHWPRSYCLLTDPHLTFRFSLSLTRHIPPQ